MAADPSNPVDFGSDIAGVFDIDPTLSVVEGRPALAHALLRRITTPRGTLIGDPSYGYDVTGLIGSTVPMSVVEQRVLEQILAEEGVEDARVTAELVNDTVTITMHVVDSEGPFDLVLTSSQLTTAAFLDSVLFAETEDA